LSDCLSAALGLDRGNRIRELKMLDVNEKVDTNHAKMHPKSAKNHSGELKPRIPTPWNGLSPN
jgi:hypothetical protein